MRFVYNIWDVWQLKDAVVPSFCQAMCGCCSWQLKLFSWKRHTSWLGQAAVGFQAVKLKLWSDWHLIGPWMQRHTLIQSSATSPKLEKRCETLRNLWHCDVVDAIEW